MAGKRREAPNWREISRTAKVEDAVFILGIPRSGTSVLYRTLQMLPEFALDGTAGQVDLTESHIFSGVMNATRANKIIEPGNTRGFSYFRRNADVWVAYCTCVKQLQSWQQLCLKVLSRSGRSIDRLLASSASGGLLWRLTLDPQVLRCYFHFARVARATDRIIEKTPGHVLHLAKIITTFPFAKVIAMTRHPVYVYASLQKRLKKEVAAGRTGAQISWLTQTPAEFCVMYGDMVAAIRLWSGRLEESIRVVRYEDLTTKKEPVLTQIFEFVNVREPSMFREDIQLQITGHRKHERDDVPLLFEPIQVSQSQWEEFVSLETAKEIEDKLESEMKWLGYSCVAG